MRFRQPQPEINRGPRLTIPVKTRTPLEAFQLLKQGNPVDVMGGYFQSEGYLGDDFFMLDKTAKLHKLAELRELEAACKADILAANAAISNHNQTINESIKEASRKAAEAVKEKPATQPAG